MKLPLEIFMLTKREQRVVIVIVMALLAGTMAKHYRDAKLHTASPLPTTMQPTASPFASRPEDERQTPDESP